MLLLDLTVRSSVLLFWPGGALVLNWVCPQFQWLISSQWPLKSGVENLIWLIFLFSWCQGYSVDEESEVRMIKQAVQYHKAQNQHPSNVVPLLGLFFGKVLSSFSLDFIFFAAVFSIFYFVPCCSSAPSSWPILRCTGFNVRPEHGSGFLTETACGSKCKVLLCGNDSAIKLCANDWKVGTASAKLLLLIKVCWLSLNQL